MLKQLLKRLMAKVGIDIRRLPAQGSWGLDPFEDQLRLMSKQGVSIIFDVGANIGQSAEQYLGLFPYSDIHCFEPFAAAFDRLAVRYATVPRVKCNRIALSERAETKRFFTNTDPLTNSLFPVAPAAQRYVGGSTLLPAGSVNVLASTIDQYCQDAGIEHIDILKMDIQGAELLALNGAQGMLARGAIALIYLEVSFAPIYEGQAYCHQITDFLHRHAYRLYGLYNIVSSGSAGLAWADAIFLAPSFASESPGCDRS